MEKLVETALLRPYETLPIDIKCVFLLLDSAPTPEIFTNLIKFAMKALPTLGIGDRGYQVLLQMYNALKITQHITPNPEEFKTQFPLTDYAPFEHTDNCLNFIKDKFKGTLRLSQITVMLHRRLLVKYRTDPPPLPDHFDPKWEILENVLLDCPESHVFQNIVELVEFIYHEIGKYIIFDNRLKKYVVFYEELRPLKFLSIPLKHKFSYKHLLTKEVICTSFQSLLSEHIYLIRRFDNIKYKKTLQSQDYQFDASSLPPFMVDYGVKSDDLQLWLDFLQKNVCMGNPGVYKMLIKWFYNMFTHQITEIVPFILCEYSQKCFWASYFINFIKSIRSHERAIVQTPKDTKLISLPYQTILCITTVEDLPPEQIVIDEYHQNGINMIIYPNHCTITSSLAQPFFEGRLKWLLVNTKLMDEFKDLVTTDRCVSYELQSAFYSYVLDNPPSDGPIEGLYTIPEPELLKRFLWSLIDTIVPLHTVTQDQVNKVRHTVCYLLEQIKITQQERLKTNLMDVGSLKLTKLNRYYKWLVTNLQYFKLVGKEYDDDTSKADDVYSLTELARLSHNNIDKLPNINHDIRITLKTMLKKWKLEHPNILVNKLLLSAGLVLLNHRFKNGLVFENGVGRLSKRFNLSSEINAVRIMPIQPAFCLSKSRQLARSEQALADLPSSSTLFQSLG
uniref:Uncharacterized protein n=1 Tax=Abalone asfa-like virus TaxID=2839893 RepID=A0A5K7XY49_9VIRU|nr:hypothetical protein [Abalone asfa-like virus]BCY04597.1 hypothetical protein [Abalone asfa-like virus]